MVIDLVGQPDQPEHKVQFLQAIEEQAKTRLRDQSDITRMGFCNGCLDRWSLDTTEDQIQVAQWLNLHKTKPTSHETLARLNRVSEREFRPAP